MPRISKNAAVLRDQLASAIAAIADAEADATWPPTAPTSAQVTTAIALYRDLGFVETAPYHDNPIPNVTFMALDLR